MKNTNQPQTAREIALSKIGSARSNLLLMIILTVVNIVLLFIGSESMLLFSATVPYYAVATGVWAEDTNLLIIGIIEAVVFLLLYLLCWYLSKKKNLWLTVALVLFIVDSIVMVMLYLWAEDVSGILDAAIHALILYYLINGVVNARKLKKLPLEEEISADVERDTEAPQSTPLRTAENDTEGKIRIFLEGDYEGHHICYRRIKRTNELVVDGYVYAELEMLIEPPHELTAKIGPTDIAVGFDGAYSYIKINGEQAAKKIRLA